MSVENRQKIPVPRRSFLWSLNETSGEILTHVGPTEFTPSANDRIVRANDRGGFEQAPMEARPFVVARDGEYVILINPVRGNALDEAPNGSFVPGGNKEKELVLGTRKIIPGPCAFPLWPGQAAEVRPAHKLGANHYLLVEVVGELDEKAPYYPLVIASAGLSSAVIDAGDDMSSSPNGNLEIQPSNQRLQPGRRIVIQGRHTQLFIPPSGIEIVPPIDETDSRDTNEDDGLSALPPAVAQECTKLIAQVRQGLNQKQFSVLKNEIRHRQDWSVGDRAIVLTALDQNYEERQQIVSQAKRGRSADRNERRQPPADPYARRAVVLGPKEFCVLFDADGHPRIVRGPARVFPGPHDTFLQRGSRRRIYDAYELAEHQALWLRIITPISRDVLAKKLPEGFVLDREHYEPGHELIVRGRPTVFFPFIEAEVIHPRTREPHVGNDHDHVIINAIGVDQSSGIYVRDLRTGMIKMVRGETSYLVDPRFEEHITRRVPREQWNLWIGHNEPHKITKEDAIVTPWALSITIPNNEACLITSRVGRRVEVGPKVVLLEYEEQLSPLKLSKGVSKDGHNTVTTSFLRIRGGRVADTFEMESSDFVKFRIKLGFAGHFEGELEPWFHVEDPIKLLADNARALVREATSNVLAIRLLHELPQIVRTALFVNNESLRFNENGMVIDHVDLLSYSIADSSLADHFGTVLRESVRLQLQDTQATRKLESARHSDLVDAEEHMLLRAINSRKAETMALERELTHAAALREENLSSEVRAIAFKNTREQNQRELEAELHDSKQKLESRVLMTLREAEAESKAAQMRYQSQEIHYSALAAVERTQLAAMAEADALRLRAITPELVGALHAAADSEVMKSAAENMNLVSLLGGKSPSELFAHVLRETPLSRTLESMQNRTVEKSDSGEE